MNVPANTFGPTFAIAAGAFLQLLGSLFHLARGVVLIAAFVIALVLGVATLVTGGPLDLPAPIQAGVDAFVLIGAASYLLESWLRGHRDKAGLDLVAGLRGRISMMEDALPAKVRQVVLDMRRRGELG